MVFWAGQNKGTILSDMPFRRIYCNKHNSVILRRYRIRMASFQGEDTELCAIEEIEVDQLFYSQRSIIDHFKCGRPVVRLLQALQRGEVRLDHPNLTLQVVEWKTWDQGEKTMRLHSSDNRRLWCLKRYKNWLGQPVYVKCRVVTYEAYRHLRTNCEHFDTMNGGTSIEVRKRKW